VRENALDLVRLLHGYAYADRVDRALDEHSLVLVATYYDRAEQELFAFSVIQKKSLTERFNFAEDNEFRRVT
jgi:hypothetical protein